LHSRPLFAMQLAVDGFMEVGWPEGPSRRIANVPGGDFEGERLRGTVVPGGADWQSLLGDGAVMLDARIVLHTDDGAFIAMTYTGIRHGPAEVMERLGRGEDVDAASYYFRVAAVFATSDSRYQWLNHVVAVGTGERLPHGPRYEIHEIL
jgi:hypothetical protein